MSNYNTVSELYEDVRRYMDRNTPDITSKIPLWVNMAEDELDRRLRHPALEGITNYTVKAGQRQIPAPANLNELKFIRIPDTNKILYRRSIEVLYDDPIYGQYPSAFASVGATYVLNLESESDYIVEYCFYVTPNKLSTTTSSNVYLVICSDYLLFKTLEEGFAFDSQPEQSAYFGQKAENVLKDINEQVNKEKYAGSTLVTFSSNPNMSTYF